MIKIENPGFLMTANKLSTNARKPSATYEITLQYIHQYQTILYLPRQSSSYNVKSMLDTKSRRYQR